MEDKRIKSALEIALERAERLGSASAEELRRQEEEKHILIGKGLSERVFVGLPLRDVEEQLGRYSGTAGQAVRRGLLDSLAEAIRPQDNERVNNALRAILQLASTEEVKSVARRIELLQHDCVAQRQSSLASTREAIASEAYSELENLGIGGSAVSPNVDSHEGWLSAQADLEVAYEEHLAPLRQELKEAIRSL